ncbi:MAG: lamin tail domain-containing protein [Deltaproteobacteria bacterium]|nr:lamin tail domain-containing protein [Deltaproteobacteria bacterium]
MRHAIVVVTVLAGCSHAADPAIDAPPSNPDAPKAPDGPAPDAPPPGTPLRIIVLNEVAPGENPDWIEVVNATTAPVQLADFVFVDKAGDLAKAVPFPQMMLSPGARFVQDVDGTIVPFKLGSDEEVWIYRASDGALSDGVDWDEGAAPTGKSYARIPDVFGPFQTSEQTRGRANQP